MFITFIAYSKRKDQTFFGGANILGGWWLVRPYGTDGIPREERNIGKDYFFTNNLSGFCYVLD